MIRQLKVAIINLIKGKDFLFDGDDLIFKQVIQKTDYYGEYGVGKSTIWAVNNTRVKRIFAVDTSKDWIEKVQSNVSRTNTLMAEWVDLGRLAKWGRPVDYSKRENILNYVKSIWQYEQKPQLILIDGRFRVACFLYSLATGAPNTKIIFDDYMDRPHYHLVEEFVKPIETCGRQCMFVIPKKLEKDKIINLMYQFLFVME